MKKRKDDFRRKTHCHGHNSFSEHLDDWYESLKTPEFKRMEQRLTFASAIASIHTGWLYKAWPINPGVWVASVGAPPGLGLLPETSSVHKKAEAIVHEMERKLLPAPSFWVEAGIKIMMGELPGWMYGVDPIN